MKQPVLRALPQHELLAYVAMIADHSASAPDVIPPDPCSPLPLLTLAEVSLVLTDTH